MKTYVGRRKPEGFRVFVVEESGQSRELRHIVRHSPTGFEVGYGGSGPADLALSMLADAVGEDCVECEGLGRQLDTRRWYRCFGCDGTGVGEFALRNYQGFKEDTVARLPRDGFILSHESVMAWVRWQEATEAARDVEFAE